MTRDFQAWPGFSPLRLLSKHLTHREKNFSRGRYSGARFLRRLSLEFPSAAAAELLLSESAPVHSTKPIQMERIIGDSRGEALLG